jgi:translation elongation factor EF-Tu-like GTPase
MDAVDKESPPPRAAYVPFLMPAEDVSDQGAARLRRVVIERDRRVGEKRGDYRTGRRRVPAVVTGVEMFQKTGLRYGWGGDNVASLRGIERADIERVRCLVKPGSIGRTRRSRRKCTLSKRGGGHTSLHATGSAVLRSDDRRDGAIKLPEGGRW